MHEDAYTVIFFLWSLLVTFLTFSTQESYILILFKYWCYYGWFNGQLLQTVLGRRPLKTRPFANTTYITRSPVPGQTKAAFCSKFKGRTAEKKFAYLISAILIISLRENKAKEMSSKGSICIFRARSEISKSLWLKRDYFPQNDPLSEQGL